MKFIQVAFKDLKQVKNGQSKVMENKYDSFKKS